jgi:hypothetical protein
MVITRTQPIAIVTSRAPMATCLTGHVQPDSSGMTAQSIVIGPTTLAAALVVGYVCST